MKKVILTTIATATILTPLVSNPQVSHAKTTQVNKSFTTKKVVIPNSKTAIKQMKIGTYKYNGVDLFVPRFTVLKKFGESNNDITYRKKNNITLEDYYGKEDRLLLIYKGYKKSTPLDNLFLMEMNFDATGLNIKKSDYEKNTGKATKTIGSFKKDTYIKSQYGKRITVDYEKVNNQWYVNSINYHVESDWNTPTNQ